MSDKTTELNQNADDQVNYQSALEINPAEIIDLFRQKKTWIVGAVLAAMIVMATLMLFTSNRYTSHASILPSGGSSNITGLMGLASNFGFGGGSGMTDENSSALYPSILGSDLVRDGVLDQAYTTTQNNSVSKLRLSEYFDLDDPNELRAALSRQTLISTDKKLGIVRIRIETTDRNLSRGILQAYLDQLEDYLNNKRRSRASENQTYLTNQVAIRSRELRDNENKLQEFMEANRNWASSTDPELNLTLGRLKREVTLSAETNLLLLHQSELARLEAQKDIPIVRLLDAPSLPTTKSGPARTVNTIFAGLTALMLVSAWIMLVSFWKQLMGGSNNDTATNTELPTVNRLRGLLKMKRSKEDSQTPVA